MGEPQKVEAIIWAPKMLERFEINRNGKPCPVYSVESDRRFDKSKGEGPMGWTVAIDGGLWKVIGVESYAINWISPGQAIGLLVEPLTLPNEQ